MTIECNGNDSCAHIFEHETRSVCLQYISVYVFVCTWTIVAFENVIDVARTQFYVRVNYVFCGFGLKFLVFSVMCASNTLLTANAMFIRFLVYPTKYHRVQSSNPHTHTFANIKHENQVLFKRSLDFRLFSQPTTEILSEIINNLRSNTIRTVRAKRRQRILFVVVISVNVVWSVGCRQRFCWFLSCNDFVFLAFVGWHRHWHWHHNKRVDTIDSCNSFFKWA